MSKRLYLINPRSVLPGYFGTEVFEAWGFAPAVGIADLATATVAALAPADWQVSIISRASSADLLLGALPGHRSSRLRVVGQRA